MLPFREKLNQEMVLAAKAKDTLRLTTLRLIKSGLHNREIDLKHELDEAAFFQLLGGMIKQRKDSIEQFEKGRRFDLSQKEQAELKIIEAFLPAQLSESDIDALIEATIVEVAAKDSRDMGKVMKVLMPKLTGRADGKAVGEKVKARLSV